MVPIWMGALIGFVAYVVYLIGYLHGYRNAVNYCTKRLSELKP